VARESNCFSGVYKGFCVSKTLLFIRSFQ